MYLSRLTFDMRFPAAARDVGLPYEMHRTLSRAFAPDGGEAAPRFLWRLEPDDDQLLPAGGHITRTVLVQSTEPAAWAKVDIPGAVEGNKKIELAALLKPGAAWQFRLLCNPAVKKAGRRYALATAEEKTGWLHRQAARHGFDLLRSRIAGCDALRANRGNASEVIVIDRVAFDGVLTVADPQRLAAAMVDGIGPGKAFGLGMLSLASPS